MLFVKTTTVTVLMNKLLFKHFNKKVRDKITQRFVLASFSSGKNKNVRLILLYMFELTQNKGCSQP